jgi:hypothetical protein
LNDPANPTPVNLSSVRIERKVDVGCDSLYFFLADGSPKPAVERRITVIAYKEDPVGGNYNPRKVCCSTIWGQADCVRTAVQGFAQLLDPIVGRWSLQEPNGFAIIQTATVAAVISTARAAIQLRVAPT